jgi:hypothetical protein
MKKLYFFLLIAICFVSVDAQIINIPDANFKAKLLESDPSNGLAIATAEGSNSAIGIDMNGNGEIEIDEALRVYSLRINSSNISDLKGIKYFKNLRVLQCSENNLSTLDLSYLSKIVQLVCDNNKLTSINLNELVDLEDFNCSSNLLTNLDLKQFHKLRLLYFNNNLLKSFDASGLPNLVYLFAQNNQLESLFLKDINDIGVLEIPGNPNLKYICGRDDKTEYFNDVKRVNEYNCTINSYCTFTPGGIFYTIKGNQKIDLDNNGCDTGDSNFPNLNFNISDGTIEGNIISNTFGNYYIPVQEGSHTITPILENPTYYTVSPSSVSVTFPTQSSPFVQEFCITPKGIHNDLELTILPTIPARPGFDATYKIIYKNKGTSVQSGSVSLSFNDSVLDYVSAIPEINNQETDKLTWEYFDLKPLESREITVTLSVNSPMETPAVNIEDRLSFNALITPVAGDEKPVNNSSALRQSVVGSFDPNDKTCLEGDVITPSLIGEYVNYLIRFENTGTYQAENIVVKDLIDLSKFDISTLVPTKASHDFVIKISDGNKVEFIFEKINLPFDDATNDGYIAFKIKTLPTLAVGDSFTNEANIYFDYNFPILTNKVTSTFKTLGTQDFEFSNYFSVYPNPTNDILNIDTKNSIQVKAMAVYDILGQLVIAVPDAQKISKIDVSKLTTGNYFLKMNTDKGSSNVKFIKKQ